MLSICVVRLSALGDVLMIVPLIRTLQKYFPEARLTWVISPPAYDLVADLDGVEFLVIDKPRNPYDYWCFYQKLRGRFFDVLLATQANFRANCLYPLIRAKRKIGYDPLRAKDGHGYFVHERILPGTDHTVDGFLKFAKALGVTEPLLRWDLPIDETLRSWAKTILPANKPILMVNPAASKPERSWLVDRYIAVLQEARLRFDLTVVLIGGPGEQDRLLGETIAGEVLVTNLIGQTKPKELLALMTQAALVLCPDTGPAHMACAVGTPVMALHAVTSAAVSGPYLYRHLAVDFYSEAVHQILNQKAEQVPWGTHIHGKETMALVTVDAVMAKLNDFFNRSLMNPHSRLDWPDPH